MTKMELLDALDYIDKNFKRCVISLNHLKTFFPKEDRNSFKTSLSRHEKSGVIKRVSKGVYMTPRATSMPRYALESLVKYIRSRELNYLSLESKLSEEGLVSQIPNRLTFMSTGRTQTFKTPLGIIEFVHTKKDPSEILKDVEFDKERNIYVATQEKALKDLKRTRRSLDLVIGV